MLTLKNVKKVNKSSVKKFTKFKPMILSRHPSHDHLRTQLGLFPFRSVIRLGSTTIPTDGKARLEINTVQAIRNSSSKRLMKECFTRAGVKTADWWTYGPGNIFVPNGQGDRGTSITDLPFPIVSKHIHGSRGTGNELHNDVESLRRWMQGKTLNNYIFEKFYNYNREYRLHVTEDGCFYTCRKMLREGTPDNERWYRNDSNCVWVLEENPSFNKPSNWNDIVSECVKALKAVGLDIGGFDIKVQSDSTKKGKQRETVDFIIIESNSACSHGEVTAVKYREILKKLLIKKYEISRSNR